MTRINQIEPDIGEEEKAELMAVVDSGWITEAGKTAQFEEMMAEYTGAKYATATVNGTATLAMALWAMEIGPGDEVIVPTFTMVATPNAVRMVGATPVFVDIDPSDLCMDLDEVEEAITPATKAIMPVHLNGRSPDMDRLIRLSREHDLRVIEDAAQALGSRRGGRHLGTFGDVGSFSFSTPKIITTGQGGILVTDDPELHQRIYEVKDFGRADRKAPTFDRMGFNFKFSDFQAAVGVAQMRKLPARVERKKEMGRLYEELLMDVPGVSFVKTDYEQVAPWFFDILLPDRKTRDSVRKDLGKAQIGTRPFYLPCHQEKPYADTPRSFAVSDSISDRGLWLPSSSFLTDEDIRRVCSLLKTALDGHETSVPVTPASA